MMLDSFIHLNLLAENPQQTFHAFTRLHLYSVLGCILLTLGMILVGLWSRRIGHFMTWRRVLGAGFMLLYIWYVLYYLFFYELEGFKWDYSLPLQFCDVAMLLVALSFLFPQRWLRSMVYIWGFAFSSFAFVTPTLWLGPEHMVYWLFWGIHVAIVGGAIHDFVVARFRMGVKDWFIVFVITLVFGGILMVVNIFIPANYGYLGNRTPDAATPLDYLGPYPWRLIVMTVIGTLLSLLVCLPSFAIRFFTKQGIMGGQDSQWESETYGRLKAEPDES